MADYTFTIPDEREKEVLDAFDKAFPGRNTDPKFGPLVTKQEWFIQKVTSFIKEITMVQTIHPLVEVKKQEEESKYVPVPIVVSYEIVDTPKK